jgi:predicted Zn-dependent protease
MSQGDPNVRATLARVYVTARQYDKAIPMLTDLVSQEPGWQDGPALLAEAYSGAGKTSDAIVWFEQHAADDPRLLPTLADFYERERRWSDAAAAYERALPRSRNAELKARYASALLNAGGRQNLTKARDVLTELTAASRTPDALGMRSLYLLSQAQRRLGDTAGAEASARKLIAQNSGSAFGYYALAEALEERRQYQAVIDALAPGGRQSARPGLRRHDPVAPSRVRLSGARTIRQIDRDLRAGASPVAQGCRPSPAIWSRRTSPPRSTAPPSKRRAPPRRQS